MSSAVVLPKAAGGARQLGRRLLPGGGSANRAGALSVLRSDRPISGGRDPQRFFLFCHRDVADRHASSRPGPIDGADGGLCRPVQPAGSGAVWSNAGAGGRRFFAGIHFHRSARMRLPGAAAPDFSASGPVPRRLELADYVVCRELFSVDGPGDWDTRRPPPGSGRFWSRGAGRSDPMRRFYQKLGRSGLSRHVVLLFPLFRCGQPGLSGGLLSAL